MLGAVTVTIIGYRLVLRRPRPFFSARFLVPASKKIDAPLVLGAALFGIGWGLSGFCPGPAITSVPLLAKGTPIFVLAMLAGIYLAKLAIRSGSPIGVKRLTCRAWSCQTRNRGNIHVFR
jgi:uncharacterized protein